MKIAYTMAEKRGDTDLLLFEFAKRLVAAGRQPAGTVQVNTERQHGQPCDMDVWVLPDGPTIRISQSLGQGARGCRLDAAALESAVAQAEAALAEGCDCLIVNKFGKHEAEGRGFRGLIAEALAQELPVIVGLNALNADAFMDFTGGMAEQVDADPAALWEWLELDR